MQETIFLISSLIISAAIGGVIGWSTTPQECISKYEKTHNIINI